jgi:hypothetical protein
MGDLPTGLVVALATVLALRRRRRPTASETGPDR